MRCWPGNRTWTHGWAGVVHRKITAMGYRGSERPTRRTVADVKAAWHAIVLGQGIDSTTVLGRLFFRILAPLAEFDREMIIEGIIEGLVSGRGRTGRRPPKLTGAKLDHAQRMCDDGGLTAEEVAGVVGVARSTLYENLSACKDGGDCVMVVYRNIRPGKVDPTRTAATVRPARARKVQLPADRNWWNVAPGPRAPP